ncbi:MAG: hypothetical protein HQ538_03505 [Parcubacteria group bacterium]|nr:hypothetical protein [Parcubacteria group bacterium]
MKGYEVELSVIFENYIYIGNRQIQGKRLIMIEKISNNSLNKPKSRNKCKKP